MKALVFDFVQKWAFSFSFIGTFLEDFLSFLLHFSTFVN